MGAGLRPSAMSAPTAVACHSLASASVALPAASGPQHRGAACCCTTSAGWARSGHTCMPRAHGAHAISLVHACGLERQSKNTHQRPITPTNCPHLTSVSVNRPYCSAPSSCASSAPPGPHAEGSGSAGGAWGPPEPSCMLQGGAAGCGAAAPGGCSSGGAGCRAAGAASGAAASRKCSSHRDSTAPCSCSCPCLPAAAAGGCLAALPWANPACGGSASATPRLCITRRCHCSFPCSRCLRCSSSRCLHAACNASTAAASCAQAARGRQQWR